MGGCSRFDAKVVPIAVETDRKCGLNTPRAKSMEDGVSTVCVERAAIGERDGKLLEPVDEMIGVRNAAYVVGCEVVPYLEAPIPRHRRDLTIDETCSLRCDLLA